MSPLWLNSIETFPVTLHSQLPDDQWGRICFSGKASVTTGESDQAEAESEAESLGFGSEVVLCGFIWKKTGLK